MNEGSFQALPCTRAHTHTHTQDAVIREVIEESGLVFEPQALIAVECCSFQWVRFTFTGLPFPNLSLPYVLSLSLASSLFPCLISLPFPNLSLCLTSSLSPLPHLSSLVSSLSLAPSHLSPQSLSHLHPSSPSGERKGSYCPVASPRWLGRITGGNLKTPAQEDRESIQASWFPSDPTHLSTAIPLRAWDCLPLVKLAREWYQERERAGGRPPFSGLPAQVGHVSSSIRVVAVSIDR